MDKNKKIVKKTKKLLKELGHDVKTGHIYEIFSKLSGFNSWNEASKKSPFFEEIFTSFGDEDLSSDFTVNSQFNYSNEGYLRDILSGKFKDVIFGGIKESGELVLLDPMKTSNILYCGLLGSGKSTASNFVSSTYLIGNQRDCLIFVIDTFKSDGAYSALVREDKGQRKNSQVSSINNKDDLLSLIDDLYHEMILRVRSFVKINAKDILDYERITGKRLLRIFSVIEDFEMILNTHLKSDTDLLEKFFTLLRVGRSYGFMFSACYKESQSYSVPSRFLNSFETKILFKTSEKESETFGNLLSSKLDPVKDKGVAYSSHGKVSFPFLKKNYQSKILDKNINSLKPMIKNELNNKALLGQSLDKYFNQKEE